MGPPPLHDQVDSTTRSVHAQHACGKGGKAPSENPNALPAPTPDFHLDTPGAGPSSNQRLRHPDFHLDTPGAGLSSNQAGTPRPTFRSRPVTVEEVDDDPPVTLADLEGWPPGLTAEDVFDQELVAEIMRDGGFQLPDEDKLIVEAFNYKVDANITGRMVSKLPRAFPDRLGNLPSEDRIRTRIATLAGIKGKFIDCCIGSCMAYMGPYKPLDKCLYCSEVRYKPDPG
ncbi:hypothetical protein FRC06_008186 [Ceratobasidium sp. 370]|nr:hypothetical protein FRC06_008186 [Ceratobasidium sp. 370]